MPRQRRQWSHAPIPREMMIAAALQYRGGYTLRTAGRYIKEYCPFHPKCDTRGMVPQHRLVMERHLGRILTDAEVVHHKNGNRQDNALENLQLFASQAEHMRHEFESGHRESKVHDPALVEAVRKAAECKRSTIWDIDDVSPGTVYNICKKHDIQWVDSRSPPTEDEVKQALLGRSTQEAARVLGCHVQTLYNHYDHLLKKRHSPGVLDPNMDEVIQIAKEYGRAYAAKKFGVSESCVTNSLKRWSKLGVTEAEAVLREKRRPFQNRRKLEQNGLCKEEPRNSRAGVPPVSILVRQGE